MTTWTVAAFDGSTWELTGTVATIYKGFLYWIIDADGKGHGICKSHLTEIA